MVTARAADPCGCRVPRGARCEDGNADRKLPKVISPVDPCSAWTAKANKRVQFGYGLNYLIDIENAVIVDVEATPARTYDEVAATKTMITRTEKRLGLKPHRLAADTAYGTGKFLGWLMQDRKSPCPGPRTAQCIVSVAQCASGSGRTWMCTARGLLPFPPSFSHGVRSPFVLHSPRPFQPALGSSMRPSKPLAKKLSGYGMRSMI